MDLKKLIQKHLKTARVMQLATSVNNQPWACNLHFYANEKFNIYWISTPQRRHSMDIDKNPQSALTIKVHEDTPNEKYVVGISSEGNAELCSQEEAEKIVKGYSAKLKTDPNFMKDILEGRNPHKFYKFTPSTFVLFDNRTFPENPRHELII